MSSLELFNRYFDKTTNAATVKLQKWLIEYGRVISLYDKGGLKLMYDRPKLMGLTTKKSITSWERGLKHAGWIVEKSTHGFGRVKIWRFNKGKSYTFNISDNSAFDRIF